MAIDESTHQRLALLREEWGAASLNEVIRRLLDKEKPVPRSMYGSAPWLPELTRELRSDIAGEDPRTGRTRKR